MQHRQPPRPTTRLHAVAEPHGNGNGDGNGPSSSTSSDSINVAGMSPDVAVVYLAEEMRETRVISQGAAQKVGTLDASVRALTQTVGDERYIVRDALLSMGSRVDATAARVGEFMGEVRAEFAALRADLKVARQPTTDDGDERVELQREAMALRARATVAERDAERARKEHARLREAEERRASQNEEALRHWTDINLREEEMKIRRADEEEKAKIQQAIKDAENERAMKRKTREKLLSIAFALVTSGGLLYLLVQQQCGG